MFFETLHIDSQSLVLAYLELLLLGLAEQIPNVFIVDLEHADLDFKGTRAILIISNFFEDFIADDRDDAFVRSVPNHRIAFARTSLSVRKQAAVIALPKSYDFYQALTKMLEPISS